MRTQMSDLREHLFDVLERLKDNEPDMDIERAKTIVEVGKCLVETQRVQNDYLKTLKTDGWMDREVIEEAGAWLKPVERRELSA